MSFPSARPSMKRSMMSCGSGFPNRWESRHRLAGGIVKVAASGPLPAPRGPWHDAQYCMKIALPSVAWSADAGPATQPTTNSVPSANATRFVKCITAVYLTYSPSMALERFAPPGARPHFVSESSGRPRTWRPPAPEPRPSPAWKPLLWAAWQRVPARRSCGSPSDPRPSLPPAIRWFARMLRSGSRADSIAHAWTPAFARANP